MDTFELKKEQLKLQSKILLKDKFSKINEIRKVAGMYMTNVKDKILAQVVLCEFPSFKVLEQKSYLLDNPLPYKLGYVAYREMPAMIEAYNKLSEEADLILVKGSGINHVRKIGIASHLGLALNVPTIGVTEKLTFGIVERGNIVYNNEILGMEIKTREYANPIYISPGYLISLGSTLKLISEMVRYPHKLPEPLHLAHKFTKKKAKKLLKEVEEEK